MSVIKLINIKKQEFFLLLILLSSAFMYSPTLKVSYLFDDFDHLYGLSGIESFYQFWNWLFIPHNEHVIPVIKIFYFIFYEFFWLNPLPFHILILATLLFCILILYKLMYTLIGSSNCALFGCAVFGLSPIYRNAIQFIGNSHILFSLVSTLSILYAIYLYANSGEFKWKVVSLISSLFASLTFITGLLSIFWIILFFLLCVPGAYQCKFKKKINVLAFPLIGWLAGLLVYFFYFKQIVFAPHYQVVGYASGIEVFNFAKGLILTFKALFLYLIPNITPFRVISYLFFALFLISFLLNFKQAKWRIISFYLLWIFINYLAVFSLRFPWGERVINWHRYHIFTSAGLSFCYAVGFFNLLEYLRVKIDFKKMNFLPSVISVLIVLYTWGNFQYVSKNTINTDGWINFYHQFKDAFQTYSDKEKKSLSNPILLKDKEVLLSMYPYPKSLRNYAEFILPEKTKRNIKWGEVFEEEFLEFLKDNEMRYYALIVFFKREGYF